MDPKLVCTGFTTLWGSGPGKNPVGGPEIARKIPEFCLEITSRSSKFATYFERRNP